MNITVRKVGLLICLAIIYSYKAFSQQDSTYVSTNPEVKFSGFVDIFYAYDFNKPENNVRQPFLYNHNRHNEFNLNLALLKTSITHKKYRGNFALQAGTYATDNYAAEENVMKHVFEANAGIALNTNNNLWLDAGIFSSHLGFESAISIQNPTLTRSLVAESSPYFLAGAKVTYTPTTPWKLAAIITNGWQRISRVPGNSLPSFGTQVKYAQEDYTLNWSTFIGTDDPDSTRRMRYFHNLYALISLNDDLDITAGFDIGMQQENKGSSSYDVWYAPTLIARYKLSPDWAIAARAEYFADENEVIISPPSSAGFKTIGTSLNVDYLPFQNIACRLEGRWLNASNKIFEREGKLTHNNFTLVGSIAVNINR